MAKDTNKYGTDKAKERYGLLSHSAKNEADAKCYEPQDPEDRHGNGYDNDASGWVRGVGKPYPNFDKGNAWRGGKLREK